jgi:hypothetical protein
MHKAHKQYDSQEPGALKFLQKGNDTGQKTDAHKALHIQDDAIQCIKKPS